MKQGKEDFVSDLVAWDLVHRIVGRHENLASLWDESCQALESLGSHWMGSTLVDVGAGCGLLGVPWLFMCPENRAVFVEPLAKKAAFIAQYLGSRPSFRGRYSICVQKIEDVSRETVVAHGRVAFLASRAFSPAGRLVEVIKKSQLADLPAYVFVKKQKFEDPKIPVFVLEDLEKRQGGAGG